MIYILCLVYISVRAASKVEAFIVRFTKKTKHWRLSTMSKLTLIKNDTVKAHVTPVQCMKESAAIARDGEGNMYLVTPLSSGKGSGKQTIRQDDYDNFTDALSDIAENGIETAEDGGYIPASVQLKRTIRFDEETGKYSFRTGSGKGEKPCSMTFAEMVELITYLRAQRETYNSRMDTVASLTV